MKQIRDFDETQFKEFVIKELGNVNDLQLIILKGHLLTEFCLNCYLESLSTNEESDFFNENFTYAIKTKLLNHFGDFNDLQSSLLKALQLLNKIRNGIAHSLELNKQLIQEFKAIVKTLADDKTIFNTVHGEKMEVAIPIAYLRGILFGRYQILKLN